MRRFLIWSGIGITSITFTILAFLPAAYLVPVIEKNTTGRITLGDVQGTLWQGSAFLGSASSGNAAVAPLLPGRFNWQISPLLLIGFINWRIENSSALDHEILVEGSWREFNISPASLTLPAERLASLGAPLNTLQPSGQMRLSWQVLRVNIERGMPNILGNMNLDLLDIASRLSPVKPLGAYNLSFAWHGQQADIALHTLQGALLLNGVGKLEQGRLSFNGTARAATGQQDQLANLLNLLGQHRVTDGKDEIVLSI